MEKCTVNILSATGTQLRSSCQGPIKTQLTCQASLLVLKAAIPALALCQQNHENPEEMAYPTTEVIAGC